MSLLNDTAIVVLHFGSPEVTETALETIRHWYPNPQSPRVFVVEHGVPSVTLERFRDVTRISLPKNLGYGAGNNQGLRVALDAGARLVILVNNDVRITPGAFEAMRRAADQPTVGIVGFPVREPEGMVWGGGRVSWWALKTHLARQPTAPAALHYIHGVCLGLTRACVERVGMLREDFFLYWEDVDYGLRARRAGFTFAVAHASPLLHLSSLHGAGRETPKTYYLVRNAVYLVSEWGTLPARWWVRVLTPLRRWVATVRGKRMVARALADAARGVVGPAPTDL
ncbi:MAG: glycosyl transferase family protein [Parcubacteria group bacterium Gr01-1014_38]|nr:MAG: glycosyl transferase family protein [Parcubacteria group bacterium Gr01-1014_38]